MLFRSQGAWSSDSRRLLTVTRDSAVRVWEFETCAPTILRGQSTSLYAASWSPDEQRVLTTSFDRTVRTWDLWGNSLTQITGLPNNAIGARWSGDGTRLFIATGDSASGVWRADGQKLLSLDSTIAEAAPSPSGQLLLVRGDRDHLHVQDATGRRRAAIAAAPARITQAAWSPDETAFLTVSNHTLLEVWDVNGTRLFARGDAGGEVKRAMWSSRGRYVIALSGDSARILARNGAQIGAMPMSGNTIESVLWSPDEERILTYSSRIYAGALWSVRGQRVDSLDGAFQFAAWSPNSRLLLMLTMTEVATVIDRDGHAAATLTGHTNRIGQAVWSPRGDRILTSSYDRTARIWDTTGKQLVMFVGHRETVATATWNHDATCVLTASFDGTARIWPVAPLLEYADRHIGREFTDDERAQFLVLKAIAR